MKFQRHMRNTKVLHSKRLEGFWCGSMEKFAVAFGKKGKNENPQVSSVKESICDKAMQVEIKSFAGH